MRKPGLNSWRERFSDYPTSCGCKTVTRRIKWSRPSTRKVLSLAAVVTKLEKDKELCRINLCQAEGEVKLFSEENSKLQKENKRLFLHYQTERSLSSSRSKTNKRKTSSHANTTPVRGSTSVKHLRHPLSPLKQNSPDIIGVLNM
ncbi:hypothetical protein MLD38_034540 [Melastoma candidum]|uniref:Uncharacterized protein n=1 Tax=Melastoma candidum TaxID=119954 RepID=A0ACB9M9V6_9MYRT|nr:hypothetical protein MLD38_034540 [Melastoma candidum]